MRDNMNSERDSIGQYNAGLLARQKDPETLVIPITFDVKLRIARHLYGRPEDESSLVRCIDFTKPFAISGGDLIRAYLFRGEYVDMKHEGGVAFVAGGTDLLVPILDGQKRPPKVLVERPFKETESALIVDRLLGGMVISRDVDVESIQLNKLDGFLERSIDDFADYNL